MSNNTAVNKLNNKSKSSKKRSANNNSPNNQPRKKKSKISKNKSKSKKKKSKSPLTNEDKRKLIESMNEFQTTLVKITKNFETINVILGKVV